MERDPSVPKIFGTPYLNPNSLTYSHGRRERGYAGGSDNPTIYVGDIDMYIPLEKPNTEPCKLYVTRTEMLGKAI